MSLHARPTQAAAILAMLLLLSSIGQSTQTDSLITDLLAPFIDVSSLTGEVDDTLETLVREAAKEMETGIASGSASRPFVPVDERYLVAPDEMQVLLDLFRNCRTGASLALKTWCTGDVGDEWDTGSEQDVMCPRGVRTHPCSGRILHGNWSHPDDFDLAAPVDFLWPWEGIKCSAYTDPTTITHMFVHPCS